MQTAHAKSSLLEWKAAWNQTATRRKRGPIDTTANTRPTKQDSLCENQKGKAGGRSTPAKNQGADRQGPRGKGGWTATTITGNNNGTDSFVTAERHKVSTHTLVTGKGTHFPLFVCRQHDVCHLNVRQGNGVNMRNTFNGMKVTIEGVHSSFLLLVI